MGGIPRLPRFALAAAVTGMAGTGVLLGTSLRRDHLARDLAEHNQGLTGSKRATPSDAAVDNLDGLARILGAGTGAAALATAAVAGLARRPAVAAGALGVGTGLVATSLLAGTKPLDVPGNAASAASFLSGQLHASMPPDRVQFGDRVPRADATDSTSSARPTAQQLLDADITLMPGTPDRAEARAQADKVVAAIDWSKPDIVAWLPGTYTHNAARNWDTSGAERFQGRGSMVLLDYPASLDFPSSVSTGMETLRLVLAEVARREADDGMRRRVLLGGHSQGAWIIGDAMATPEIRAMVDRAALFGNPGLAERDYTDRRDAKVVEVNGATDPITKPVRDRNGFIAAMGALDSGVDPGDLPALASSAIANPEVSAYWVAASADPERWVPDDPHTYYQAYVDALSWLDTGVVEPRS